MRSGWQFGNARWLVLSVLVIALDQWSKQFFVGWLALGEVRPVFAGWFNWTMAHNTGVAFSMFNDGETWQRYGLAAFALAVTSGLTVWLMRVQREPWTACGLALVIGGALGNVIDRVRLGYVIDFIQWYYRDWYWPAFNLADSAISVGVVVLLIASFRGEGASDVQKARA
jgi:signal peptidase II